MGINQTQEEVSVVKKNLTGLAEQNNAWQVRMEAQLKRIVNLLDNTEGGGTSPAAAAAVAAVEPQEFDKAMAKPDREGVHESLMQSHSVPLPPTRATGPWVKGA